MKPHALLGLAILVFSAQPATAQSGDQVRGSIAAIAGAIGGAIEQGRFRKDVASMSAPLEYQSSNIPFDSANDKDPRNFDVAGLRLGMTPEDAKRILAQGGYTVSQANPEPSFDTQVRRATQTGSGPIRQNLVINRIEARASHAQSLTLNFDLLPEGPRLARVRFQMSSQDMSPEAFNAQVMRKYGDTAMQDDGDVLMWCTGPEGCQDWSRHAYLRAEARTKTIDLYDLDEGRDAALAERLNAEIEKRKLQVQEAKF